LKTAEVVYKKSNNADKEILGMFAHVSGYFKKLVFTNAGSGCDGFKTNKVIYRGID
jgi:hypothetical protein